MARKCGKQEGYTMIMTCPKCRGTGKEYVDTNNGGQSTSIATYTTACSSCGGTGYVTDTPQYIRTNSKCSKCGKDMTINLVCSECQIKDTNHYSLRTVPSNSNVD